MTKPLFYDMDSAPKHEAARFLMIGGGEVIGQYEPYWCGSDCPCGLGNDVEPECWGVFPIVNGRVMKDALNDEPEGWRPL